MYITSLERAIPLVSVRMDISVVWNSRYSADHTLGRRPPDTVPNSG